MLKMNVLVKGSENSCCKVSNFWQSEDMQTNQTNQPKMKPWSVILWAPFSRSLMKNALTVRASFQPEKLLSQQTKEQRNI